LASVVVQHLPITVQANTDIGGSEVLPAGYYNGIMSSKINVFSKMSSKFKHDANGGWHHR
jgi:hypothetical protein